MSNKEIFLHIGTHKTGTTSIQQFLSDYNSVLNKFDIGFFEGRFIRSNHVELHVAAMHPDRMSPIKHIRNLSPSAEFVCETKSAVRYFLEESSLKKIVFSAEGLSYLRLPCELEMLKSILGVDQVKIIVVLRSKMDFLRSYSEQLRKMGFSPSNERGSFLYVEPDSWLVDYASLIGAYQDTFGKENVIVKSYSEELERYGSIIPSLLNILGVPSYIFSRDKDLWLNRSTG